MFSHDRTEHFATFLSGYRRVLEELAEEGELAKVGIDEYEWKGAVRRRSFAELWGDHCKLVPRYWATFQELHSGGIATIEAYLDRRARNLDRQLQGKSEMIEWLLSNAFLSFVIGPTLTGAPQR
jgi:hypothetical protein